MESTFALSVLDGRYSKLTEELRGVFSEYGLIRHRVRVEIQWLLFLLKTLRVSAPIADADERAIRRIADAFGPDEALAVKETEKTTNHDVKAVEYFIKDRLRAEGLGRFGEWVHFACTSEDISNTAYALMISEGRKIVLRMIDTVLSRIEALAIAHRNTAMMSRTHGQPASPTTVGKEFVNFAWRIRRERDVLARIDVPAKMNGATGNYNAHVVALPDVDWIQQGARFIREHLNLTPLFFTTQINPYNAISELLHATIRLSAVIIDLDRDMWGYISLGYFKQKLRDGEIGSSTMPHKVNPIDFENSEGNMGLAVSLMEHLAFKLLISRFQRDLTDSTVLRNLGAVFGYVLIGLKNTLKGLNKIDINTSAINGDMKANPELLAEPIQTLMRMFDEENPYEKLKALTRGRSITQAELSTFIDSLEKVPEAFKSRLKALTVDRYIGLAAELVDLYFKEGEEDKVQGELPNTDISHPIAKEAPT